MSQETSDLVLRSVFSDVVVTLILCRMSRSKGVGTGPFVSGAASASVGRAGRASEDGAGGRASMGAGFPMFSLPVVVAPLCGAPSTLTARSRPALASARGRELEAVSSAVEATSSSCGGPDDAPQADSAAAASTQIRYCGTRGEQPAFMVNDSEDLISLRPYAFRHVRIGAPQPLRAWIYPRSWTAWLCCHPGPVPLRRLLLVFLLTAGCGDWADRLVCD